MGMLLKRHHEAESKKAEGATKAVAPKAVKVAEVVEDKTPEVEEVKELSRTEINRLTANEAREYAKSKGVKDVEDKSGAELKRILCDMLFSE